jgi:hypothetical protein
LRRIEVSKSMKILGKNANKPSFGGDSLVVEPECQTKFDHLYSFAVWTTPAVSETGSPNRSSNFRLQPKKT